MTLIKDFSSKLHSELNKDYIQIEGISDLCISRELQQSQLDRGHCV